MALNYNEYQEIRAESYQSILDIEDDYSSFFQRPCNPDSQEPPFQPFFRGQAVAARNIQASINFRKKAGEIIRPADIYNLLPNSVKTPGRTLFDLIAHIQHYHTGTRFVDFTTDINIAIYFACEKHPDEDGAVFLWAYAPHLPEWYTTCAICELELLVDENVISIGKLSEILLGKYKNLFPSDNINEVNGSIVSFLGSGMMVLPDRITYENNERLYRQKGAFFICPPTFTHNLSNSDRWFSNAGNQEFVPDSAVDIFNVWDKRSLTKLIIPKELKSDLLRCLKEKGITEEYLLPKDEKRI